MTITKHYCDHCGKEVRNGNALRPVELHPFHWGATTVRHVCAKCLEDIEEYIGTAKHGADATVLRDVVRRFLDLFTPGTIHQAGTTERLLREARAAIGEGVR